MPYIVRVLIGIISTIVTTSVTLAQTSGPASRPTTRRTMVMPPGFSRVRAGSRVALCQAQDESWVKAALASAQPATRPTTMPSDLSARLAEQRTDIAKQMIADLGVDESAVAKLFDESVLPSLRQLDRLDPPVFYLVLTRPKLISLLRSGWEDPRFYYNRAANDVSFNMNVTLAVDHDLDDTILPILYGDKDDETANRAAVVKIVRETEESVVNSISGRALFLVQMGFVEFIGRNVVVPLKLADDQQWFGLGLVGAVGAKYGAQAIGMPRADILRQMTFEHPRMPVKVATIDLLHPTPLSDLRKEYVPFYVDAMRRKSTAVISAWIERAGDRAIAKTLDAIRKKTPTDGPALVNVINETTGQDLTKDLSAR